MYLKTQAAIVNLITYFLLQSITTYVQPNTGNIE